MTGPSLLQCAALGMIGVFLNTGRSMLYMFHDDFRLDYICMLWIKTGISHVICVLLKDWFIHVIHVILRLDYTCYTCDIKTGLYVLYMKYSILTSVRQNLTFPE